jgi:hypothetical protein
MKLIKGHALPSLSRAIEPERQPVRVAAIQMHWESDAARHADNLLNCI